MHKLFIAAALTFTFLGSTAVWAETQPAAQTEETELDREADNLNIVPYEERLKLKRSSTKAIDMKLKNLTKGEISDIIKNINQTETKNAKLEGRTAEVEAVNPTDKKEVRKFLQKGLFLDPHPRLY